MEHRYKNALQSIYKAKLAKTISPDYREHLFSNGWFYTSLKEIKTIPINLNTEKNLVIQSFNQFGQNLLEKSGKDKLVLDKIEISKKELKQNTQVSFDELVAEILKVQSKDNFKQRYVSSGVNKQELTNLKVVFVSDTLLESPVQDQTELDEFNCLFDQETSSLFSKMVKAMKLTTEDYLLTAITIGEDEVNKGNNIDLVLKEINYFKPELVITLGVSASHALINTNERLKNLHGNFYPLQLTDFNTEVMPLFSPSLLRSAPHMKSITWVDMQKAMEKLAK